MVSFDPPLPSLGAPDSAAGLVSEEGLESFVSFTSPDLLASELDALALLPLPDSLSAEELLSFRE